MRKCPKCHLKVSDKTRKCPFCGTKVPNIKDQIGKLPELIATPKKITEFENLENEKQIKINKIPLKVKPVKNNSQEKSKIAQKFSLKKKLKKILIKNSDSSQL